MKRSRFLGVIGLLFFSPLPLFFAPTPVTAIGFSCQEFWFFVDEPTCIDYPQMIFSVWNNHLEAMRVICSVEQVEGVNVSVEFDWQEQILAPDERKNNHYCITINSPLTILYTLKIYISAEAVDGSTLATGGIILNHVQYYSEKEGALLDLAICDQSEAPREALVEISHRVNDSYAWTPFKTINGSRFQAYVPLGMYEVRVWDTLTGIYGETLFTLTNDTTHTLTLELVGFKQLQYITNMRGDAGVNITINNYVEELTEVEIYVELYCDAEMISQTPTAAFSKLERTSAFTLDLWFRPFQWEEGFYSMEGYIVVGGVVIASEYTPLGTPQNYPTYEGVIVPPLTIAVLIGATIILILIVWRRRT